MQDLNLQSENNASCRVPLLVLFVSAAVWLVIGSGFGLITSIKFHSPNFLADCAHLTYGRVRPAYFNAVLYGFCIQAAVGVALWLFVRLGRTCLAQPWLVLFGAMLWNLGVTVGVLGILAGDSTGFPYLEMPGYAAWIIMLGYLLIGIAAGLTFHQRTEAALFVSQWFLLAALFWFPWIYSTAELLLVTFPVRGAAQAAIAWWYSANLGVTLLALAGLAPVFYFIPKLTARELHSRYLTLFTFWMVILFGGWCGMPNSAPLPAWMPALSTVAAVLMLVSTTTVALNVHHTLRGSWSKLACSTSLLFIGAGVVAFIFVGLANAVGAVIDVRYSTSFTWITPAVAQLSYYGFFTMVMFGSIYYLLPQVMGVELPWPKLVRAHFWLALAGLLLVVVPLGIGGSLEAARLNKAEAFLEVLKGTLPFLRVSTIGDLLIAIGHILFLLNLAGLVSRFYRPRAASAFEAATADVFAAEVRS